jgi:hypothetical protein
MSEAEIVPLGADPREERRASRRQAIRMVAPIGAALLLVLSVIGLLVAAHESNAAALSPSRMSCSKGSSGGSCCASPSGSTLPNGR